MDQLNNYTAFTDHTFHSNSSYMSTWTKSSVQLSRCSIKQRLHGHPMQFATGDIIIVEYVFRVTTSPAVHHTLHAYIYGT
eukprot:2431658-Amphidinium_carterae.5